MYSKQKSRLIVVILTFAIFSFGCAGTSNYRQSLKFFEEGDFTESKDSIDMALNEKPSNRLFIEQKEIVCAKLLEEYDFTFQHHINHYDLDAQLNNTIKRQVISEALYEINSKIYAPVKVRIENDHVGILKRFRILNADIKLSTEQFENHNYLSFLNKLWELEVYKGYVSSLDEFYTNKNIYLPAIQKHILEKLSNEFPANLNMIDLADKVFGKNEYTEISRKIFAKRYYDKANLFLEAGLFSVSQLYKIIGDKYNSEIRENYKFSSESSLKAYDEKLYIKFAGLEEDEALTSYEKQIADSVNQGSGGVLTHSEALKGTTLAILGFINRKDNSYSIGRPMSKYSKFISGYNRVPNEYYYRVQNAMQLAQSELQRLAAQPVYGWADGFAKGLAMGIHRNSLAEYSQILGSGDVYDKIPIYTNYTYNETDIEINSLFEIEYTIIDRKTKTIFKRDTHKFKDYKEFTYLEGVHQDDNNLQNSVLIDQEYFDKRFDNFIINSLNEFSDSILSNIGPIYTKRFEEYKSLKEYSNAFDIYLAKVIYTNRNHEEKLYNIYTENLSNKLIGYDTDTIPTTSNLESKLSRRVEPNIGNSYFDKALNNDGYILAKFANKKPERSLNPVEIAIEKVVKIVSSSSQDKSTGSGFFVNKDGYIVTNYHVIKNSNSIEVTLHNNKKFMAEVIMSDSMADLALIKIRYEEAPYFEFCNYSNVSVGETVIAIGSPHGYDRTVSKGIVSAKRNMPLPFSRKKSILQIQTDVLITHGNSGGPLINNSGEVLGINTWTENVDGKTGALNFAISADEARKRFSYYINQ